MYDFLKNIALLNNWEFLYARKDFQNLFNEEECKDKIHLFVDPIKKDKRYSESNTLESTTYTGNFMLLLSSDIDECYEERYETYIKPLATEAVGLIEDSFACDSEFTVNSWNETEVINLFDYNLDGIVVNYSITTEDV